MRNILIIWQKELRSYFASPIAYLLLTMFALIFGFFFWNSLGYFVLMGMESQMRGQTMPMNLNEIVIRPLLSNVGVIGLFFLPKRSVAGRLNCSQLHQSATSKSSLENGSRP